MQERAYPTVPGIYGNPLQPSIGTDHHRLSPTAPVKPPKRLHPRPTSGRNMPRLQATKPRTRRARSTEPSARALHAAWAKGKAIV